jgi:hypothetical protein
VAVSAHGALGAGQAAVLPGPGVALGLLDPLAHRADQCPSPCRIRAEIDFGNDKRPAQSRFGFLFTERLSITWRTTTSGSRLRKNYCESGIVSSTPGTH